MTIHLTLTDEHSRLAITDIEKALRSNPNLTYLSDLREQMVDLTPEV